MRFAAVFLPYALAAFLIGLVGGASSLLGPAFVADLGLDSVNTTWTALAQAMSTAACAPILGKVGDSFGRGRTLLAGLTVFLAGNILSALAGSLGVMLAARFIVGIGTAAMAPLILACITTELPPEKTARGFSVYMLISGGAVILGALLGTVLLRRGWRVMQWGCAAAGAAVLPVCLLTVRKHPSPSVHAPLNWRGAVPVVLFFSLALCLPAVAQTFGWGSAPLGILAMLCAVALIWLVRSEARARQPVLSGQLLRQRVFLCSVAALFLTQGLLQANVTNVLMFIRDAQPENAALSGYAVCVLYAGVSAGAILLGPLADRTDPRLVLAGAMALTGGGCALLLLFGPSMPLWLPALALGLLGFGLGAGGTILMKVALSRLNRQQAGAAAGTYGLFRDLAAPFGVAVLVPLYTNRAAALHDAGLTAATAAQQAMHTLGAVELGCIAAGLIAVWLLPGREERKESHETGK